MDYISITENYVPVKKINEKIERNMGYRDQYNVRMATELKTFVKETAKKDGMTMSSWILDKVNKFITDVYSDGELFTNFPSFIRFVLIYEFIKVSFVNRLLNRNSKNNIDVITQDIENKLKGGEIE